jgi:YgiT-type zinc finger domain-containing protein
MICSVCSEKTRSEGIATQVFRRDGLTVTITGIPAVAICPHCGNAVLDWEVAQQVKPIISITFPETQALAA